jgi:hypothetical protein
MPIDMSKFMNMPCNIAFKAGNVKPDEADTQKTTQAVQDLQQLKQDEGFKTDSKGGEGDKA